MSRVLPFKHLPLRTRLAAVAAARCPRCRGARIFRGRLAMNRVCPACGLRFEREPGYFTGAMYVSYALAVPLIAALTAVVYLIAPHLSFEATLAVATVLFLPCVPAIFRISRVVWIHFVETVDPSA